MNAATMIVAEWMSAPEKMPSRRCQTPDTGGPRSRRRRKGGRRSPASKEGCPRSEVPQARAQFSIRVVGRPEGDAKHLIQWALPRCSRRSHNVSVAVQVDREIRRETASASGARLVTDGKFPARWRRAISRQGREYGTFAPMPTGISSAGRQIAEDFRRCGARAEHGPRLHPAAARSARRSATTACACWWACPGRSTWRFSTIVAQAGHSPRASRPRAELGDHPAVLMFALGNEIPPVSCAGTAACTSSVSSQHLRRGKNGVTRRLSPTSTSRD